MKTQLSTAGTEAPEQEERETEDPDRDDWTDLIIPKRRPLLEDDEGFGVDQAPNDLAETDFDQQVADRSIRALTPARVSFREPPSGRFLVLEQWIGTVESISEETFIARLRSVDPFVRDEEAEFDIEEVSVADRDLLATGSEFYWSVGYRDTLSGQRMRASTLRFRRLPHWTTAEIRQAEKYGDSVMAAFGWT